MYSFKQDLQAYRGQDGTAPIGGTQVSGERIGGSTGSMVNPSFSDDIQQYRSETGTEPIVAKQVEYNKVVENTNKKIEEQKAKESKPYDPTGKTIAQIYAETGRQSELDQAVKEGKVQTVDIVPVKVHQAKAPEVLLPSENVEIDYANEDLSTKDFAYIKEGTKGGQCGVFAQNVAKLPGGGSWTVGDTIQQKTNSIKRYRDAGLAFLPGEDMPQAGNSVIINPGTKWGHVAVVNSVNPDGTITLTESNWNWDERVTHSRRIPANDRSIVGYIRTQ